MLAAVVCFPPYHEPFEETHWIIEKQESLRVDKTKVFWSHSSECALQFVVFLQVAHEPTNMEENILQRLTYSPWQLCLLYHRSYKIHTNHIILISNTNE